MTTQNAIVVGIDGSEAGRGALRWSLDQAAHTGAEVHAVTAWSFEVSAVPGVNDPFAAAQRAKKLLAEDVEAILADRLGTAVVQYAIEGAPTGVLVDASADAALLVVGTHRHGRLYEALLGSVTAGCLRHATCPVVVVPTDSTAPKRHHAAASGPYFEGGKY